MLHTEIKTYSFTEKSDNRSGFSLRKLEDVEHNYKDSTEKPHRHDYYTILFIEKGEGTHFIDFMEYKLEDNTIYFILPGQMHQLVFTAEPVGWLVTFTEEFLIANSIPEKLINDIYLFNDFGQSPPLPLNEKDLPIYKSLIEQMYHYSSSLETYTLEAVGAVVKLFLIQSNNHCTLRKTNNPQLIETGNHILRTFKHLLNEKYTQTHRVSDYADDLSVTADYLNKTVKNLTGKSAKDHIQSKLITEAKRSLLFSNITNKELSFDLGFDESAHFNNFFKKITGQTPSEFRALARQS
ncbi:MAG: AraC family transcriptional regulator [Paludibacteraceae bacterium]